MNRRTFGQVIFGAIAGLKMTRRPMVTAERLSLDSVRITNRGDVPVLIDSLSLPRTWAVGETVTINKWTYGRMPEEMRDA